MQLYPGEEIAIPTNTKLEDTTLASLNQDRTVQVSLNRDRTPASTSAASGKPLGPNCGFKNALYQ